MMNIQTNSTWNVVDKPYVTVITPVYNRQSTIKRAFESIQRQTFKNFEYIIIDDGSTDDSNAIARDFMNATNIPTMLITKGNGGVHSARNAGIKNARGGVYSCLDSDDEFLPDGLEKLVRGWESIPTSIRNEYFEVKARCLDENGHEIGDRFPEGANQLPWSQARELYESVKGEHCGLRPIHIMKENLWPEPIGITFVGEDIVWYKLRSLYKTWMINDCVQVYHTEGEDHIAANLIVKKKRNIQYVKNSLWNLTYQLNHFDLYGKGQNKRKKLMSRQMLRFVLLFHGEKLTDSKLIGLKNRLFSIMVAPFAALEACVYQKLRM